MEGSSTKSLLDSIASRHTLQNVQQQQDGTGSVMKETGHLTNNMLLGSIFAEQQRTANEVMRLSSEMSSIKSALSNLNTNVERMCTLMESQLEVTSNNILSMDTTTNTTVPKRDQQSTTDWFYQGTKLSSRNHVYACIIMHLIEMVQTQMEDRSIHYPDSVDCTFKVLHSAVRIVSSVSCNVPGVAYRNEINTKDKDSQAFQTIYPYIASREKSKPMILPESSLSKICNPVTRNMMIDVEWICQRLVLLDGILSAKQIDIIKSIRHPVLRSGSMSDLNIDIKSITPRGSHPLVPDIASLAPLKKEKYIKFRMKNTSIISAYQQSMEESKQ